jgi:tetratricopeptide (TPR) repeat protein
MMSKSSLIAYGLTGAVALLLCTFNVALAASPEMKEGVAEFNAGNYKQAESLLGIAQSAEFSNPVFHYFLANTYVKLNKKDLAIQEFRIAFALAPEKEVGKLSRQALGYLGVEEETKKTVPTRAITALPPPPKDMMLENAKQSLKLQAEAAKDSTRSRAERDALELAKLQQEALAKAQKELEENIAKGKGNREALRRLQQMRQHFETQRASLDRGDSRAQELQKSADNLQTLLEDKRPISTPRLSPVGTNLYVRNYAGSSASTPVTTQTTTTTVHTTSGAGTGQTTSQTVQGKLKKP